MPDLTDDDDAFDPTWRPKRVSSAGPALLGEESGEVTVRPFRTGEKFDKPALLDGLHLGKLQGTVPFGLLYFLSHVDDDDVRVVLGRQGEQRVRRYDPHEEKVSYWTLARALLDTVAIRYSADPDTGFLRFTMFGGGNMPEALVDWFQAEFAGIPRGSPVQEALDPAHVRSRCFDTDFLRRLYSIQAQLDAEGYETIDHTLFKSRMYIDPDCKRMLEFRAAATLLVESFESEVDVRTEDMAKKVKVRFVVRTASGNIRLILPKVHYKPTIKDESAHTRAFYGLCEKAVADIVGLDAPVAAHLDPASEFDSLFARVMPTVRHRAYLSRPGNRARFFDYLELGQPQGCWLPHLRALDEIAALGPIPGLDDVLDRLAADDPEQAVLVLATTQRQRLFRLGKYVLEAVLRRLPTLPRSHWPATDEVLLEWALDDQAADWRYDAHTDAVELYGVLYEIKRLSESVRAKALLRAAMCEHYRTIASAPDARGTANLHAVLMRLARLDLLESDPPAAHAIREHTSLGSSGLLRVLAGDDFSSEPQGAARVLALHRLPLWPLLVLDQGDGRPRLRNTGLGAAEVVHVGEVAVGDMASGTSVVVEGASAGADVIHFQRYGLKWRAPVAPIEATPQHAGARSSLIVERRRLFDFRRQADPEGRFHGQSEAMWRAIEQAYLAHRQEPRPHVLIEGETGTGKTELARMLHRASGLEDGKFIRVTGSSFAGAGDEHAVRGALLGYAPNHGYTGIPSGGRAGFIQRAAGGTMFVDDFEALPGLVQHLLLDALAGEPMWMEGDGGKHAITATCRFLLATNAGAQSLVDAKAVRRDLLARVGASVVLPPLREHIADAFEIVKSLVPDGQKLTFRAWWAILRHAWPDNVRELLKVIKDAAVVSREVEAPEIDARHMRLLPTAVVDEAERVTESDAERDVLLAVEAYAVAEGYQRGAIGRGLRRRVGELLDMNESKVSRMYTRLSQGKAPPPPGVSGALR